MSYPATSHCYTVTEYHQMISTGVISEDDRIELLNGEIIEMSAVSPSHAAGVKRAARLFNRRVSHDIIVSVQDPIQLDDFSEPQPDVALLRPRADLYKQSHPKPADILLVVEVAESAVVRDRILKAPAYVRALIAELWIVDLQQDLIEVYLSPASGAYQAQRQAGRGETLVPQLLPTLNVPADEMLG